MNSIFVGFIAFVSNKAGIHPY